MGARWCSTMAAALVSLLVWGGCGEKTKEEKKHSEVPLRVNLIKNPSFEEWNEGSPIPIGWELQRFDGSGKKNLYGQAQDEKTGGGASFYLRGVYDVEQWMVLVQRFPVIPGYRLAYSAEMKSNGISRSKGQKDRANIYVRFYDKDGKRVSDRYYADSGTSELIGSNDWRKYGKTTDIPAEARSGEIGLINQLTGWMYYDDVSVMIEEPIPWKHVQTKHVTFYYLPEYPFPTGAVDKEAAFVEDCVKKLGIKPEGKISYYYYGTEQSFRNLLGVKSVHGRAAWQRQEFHSAKPFDDHEIIHVLLGRHGYPPFGLAEGVVFYVLGSWEGRDLHMMAKELILQQRMPALHKLLKQEDLGEAGLSNVIPGWASFSIWLINRYGIDKFMKLYVETNEVAESDAFNERFKKIYGKDFDGMDRDWRLWVLRYQSK